MDRRSGRDGRNRFPGLAANAGVGVCFGDPRRRFGNPQGRRGILPKHGNRIAANIVIGVGAGSVQQCIGKLRGQRMTKARGEEGTFLLPGMYTDRSAIDLAMGRGCQPKREASATQPDDQSGLIAMNGQRVLCQRQGENGDVVLLAELPCCLGNLVRILPCERREAIESIQFAGLRAGLGHAIRNEYKTIIRRETAMNEFVHLVGDETERQSRRCVEFAAGEIRSDVSGVGEGELARERNTDAASGGEAELAFGNERIIQAI